MLTYHLRLQQMTNIGIFSKLIDITKSQTRALSKIFNYGDTEETSIEVPTLSRSPTRTKPGIVSKLHCPCGVLKHQ